MKYNYKWERCINAGINRLRVPGGWVVAISTSSGGGICFVPDQKDKNGKLIPWKVD